jgi:hypothetical protein
MYAGPCKEPLEQTGVHLGDTDPREAVGAVLCPAELYAIAGASTVTCPKCRVEHNLDARQDWLLGEVEDQLAHPALIARALSSLGRPITDSMIRGWKFRGRLIPHGLDVRGRETFRIGDVLDLLAVEVARAERNMQKRVRREERTAS